MEASGNLRYLALLHQARSASEEALGRDHEALASFKRYAALQQELQDKMRLEQGRMLQYEYEIGRRDFENQRLRAERKAQAQQLTDLRRIRNWQRLAMACGLLLAALLAAFAWRQWGKSRRLRALALVDSLTGAATRRAFDASVADALAEARRIGTPLSLLALDLDRFKNINDRYGHPAGDRVLAATTRAWQALLRERDLLARIGGEEFVVVCPDATLAKARGIATRLLEATEALRFDDIDPALRVGVSIGLAQTEPGDTLATLHSRADAALYRAKQGGRGRVEG
jgi:diguanylate cyclase (GGDEF)-like protein